MQRPRFVIVIEACQKQFPQKNLDQFIWLRKFKVTDAAVLVIMDHLNIITSDFKERFSG